MSSLHCWAFAWLNDCANGDKADFTYVQTQKKKRKVSIKKATALYLFCWGSGSLVIVYTILLSTYNLKVCKLGKRLCWMNTTKIEAKVNQENFCITSFHSTTTTTKLPAGYKENILHYIRFFRFGCLVIVYIQVHAGFFFSLNFWWGGLKIFGTRRSPMGTKPDGGGDLQKNPTEAKTLPT